MTIVLLIAALLAGVAVWLLVEHHRTTQQIERLQQDLRRLQEEKPKDSRWHGAPSSAPSGGTGRWL